MRESELVENEEDSAKLKVEFEAKLIDSENRLKVERKQYRQEISSLQEHLNEAMEEMEKMKELHSKELENLKNATEEMESLENVEVVGEERCGDKAEVSSLYSCDIRPIMNLERNYFPEMHCLQMDLRGEIEVVRQMLGNLDSWKSHIVKRKSRL
eukprot:UN24533